jgi:hypothetical protein
MDRLPDVIRLIMILSLYKQIARTQDILGLALRRDTITVKQWKNIAGDHPEGFWPDEGITFIFPY